MSKWDERFLDMAEHVAKWSKDPSTKVGCVIVDDSNRIVSLGYNGFPRGVDDKPDRLNDRPTKYSMVVHAEANAIIEAQGRATGCTAYVTHFPCSDCAGLIIQAGVTRVVSRVSDMDRWRDSHTISRTMFEEAGVEIITKTPTVSDGGFQFYKDELRTITPTDLSMADES